MDCTSKFAFAHLVERATRSAAADFLRELIKVIPYQIHIVLTDNGTHFTTPGNICSAAADIKLGWQRGELFRAHVFEAVCARHDIDHRLTKPNHPWTNGQVERMNRTIKEATVRTYHYDSHAQLREHLAAFLNAYNFAKRLKTLGGLTSYQFICSCFQKEPLRFISSPHRLSPGLTRQVALLCRGVRANRDLCTFELDYKKNSTAANASTNQHDRTLHGYSDI